MIEPGPGAEREPNDDRGTANDLIVGDNATGFIGGSAIEDGGSCRSKRCPRRMRSTSRSVPSKVSPSSSKSRRDGTVARDAQGTARCSARRARALAVVKEGASPFHYVTIKGRQVEPRDDVHAARAGARDRDRRRARAERSRRQADADAARSHGRARDVDARRCRLLRAHARCDEQTVDVSVDTPHEINLDVELLVDGKSVAIANKAGKGAVEKLSAQGARERQGRDPRQKSRRQLKRRSEV